MAMSVLSQMAPAGQSFFYSDTWRQIVETHLIWLRARNESSVIYIEPHIALKYEGDFYGALIELRVPPYLFYVILRMNGLYNPSDFNGEAIMVMVPILETIQQLAAVAGTTNKKVA